MKKLAYYYITTLHYYIKYFTNRIHDQTVLYVHTSFLLDFFLQWCVLFSKTAQPLTICDFLNFHSHAWRILIYCLEPRCNLSIQSLHIMTT